MDPFLPSVFLFFVLCFILLNGGGLSAILFWLAVVAGLSLLFHHFSLSNRVVVPVGGRRTHALLAALTALLCSALICWKIYYVYSKHVAVVCFFLITCFALSALLLYGLTSDSLTLEEQAVERTVHMV